ncbi:hypothetical protein MRS44_013897 [Fusarium solani]|uniref:uncharacterized protein n=1 Tax=Fusarium solani TaxID=169388 RepID=UPI0032C47D41|nr:hypothetical protein MRS44_013897 [Fusarium solani]
MSSSSLASKEAAAFPDGTIEYEPLRSNTKYNPKKVHIADTPMTWPNIHLHINWLNTTLIIIIPIIGFISAYWVPLHLYTGIWAVIFYFNTGLGITAGYHRLWAHTSYKATTPLKFYLAAVGAGAVEGSIRWWSYGHRAHHRYTDTEKDPYSVRKGLLYSHVGWMVFKQNPKRQGRADITDLNEDPIVVWQHRNYFKCVIFMALVLPTIVAGFGWSDWLGGFVYAGEGYHNFHHEFPSDYRNAIKWYQYDPTKWSIWIWKQLGLAYDLKQFRQNEIEKGRVQQLQKKLDQKRATLDWGIPLEQLPVVHWDDFVADSKNGKALVAIAGVIHNVTDFIKDHPGGKALISSAIGKDATAIFNGGVYNHSNAAHNLLSAMRVGILRGGCEVEIWKRAQFENKDATYMNDSAGQRIVRAGAQITKVT